MKRRHRIKWPTLLIFCVLFVGLQTLGVTYARWTGVLQIGGTATTGVLDVQTSREETRAFLVDSEGNDLKVHPVGAELGTDGETLLFTVDGDFVAAALAGDQLLKLEIPFQQGEKGTVNRVELTQADLSAPADGEVELIPSDPELVVDEKTLHVPSGTLDAFDLSLRAEVYRQVEARHNGRPIAVVYLRLTEESQRKLNDLMENSSALDVDAADVPQLEVEAGKTAKLDAQVRVRYTCDLSLYVEQGNKNSLLLPGEE